MRANRGLGMEMDSGGGAVSRGSRLAWDTFTRGRSDAWGNPWDVMQWDAMGCLVGGNGWPSVGRSPPQLPAGPPVVPCLQMGHMAMPPWSWSKAIADPGATGDGLLCAR